MDLELKKKGEKKLKTERQYLTQGLSLPSVKYFTTEACQNTAPKTMLLCFSSMQNTASKATVEPSFLLTRTTEKVAEL